MVVGGWYGWCRSGWGRVGGSFGWQVRSSEGGVARELCIAPWQGASNLVIGVSELSAMVVQTSLAPYPSNILPPLCRKLVVN